jgi:hypothetical protein
MIMEDMKTTVRVTPFTAYIHNNSLRSNVFLLLLTGLRIIITLSFILINIWAVGNKSCG